MEKCAKEKKVGEGRGGEGPDTDPHKYRGSGARGRVSEMCESE